MMNNVFLYISDHLLRLAELDQLNRESTPLLISVLTLAMQKSSRVSLMLVRRGIFISKCNKNDALFTSWCSD